MTRARLLGIVLRSIVLGTLLFVAILGLLELSSVSRIFRYQGF